MSCSTDRHAIVAALCDRFPSLLLAYAFGSRVEGTSAPTSDLDLAILVEGRADPLALFDASNALAELAGCDVDLVDLRAASTIMQNQIITRGLRLYAREPLASLFESMVLSEKLELDAARAGLIADIEREGRVYDR
ncbi:MAG: nucleotidyltransferase domain-containing protein [Methylocystaceae bacterium]|nr:MAG: nucleotidyltransferase domain-containing protein [Methylocystaceae bacterium]